MREFRKKMMVLALLLGTAVAVWYFFIRRHLP